MGENSWILSVLRFFLLSAKCLLFAPDVGLLSHGFFSFRFIVLVRLDIFSPVIVSLV